MRETLAVLVLSLWLCGGAGAQAPPSQVRAFDTPNDGGGRITLTWRAGQVPAGASYLVEVAGEREGPYHPAARVSPGASLMVDDPATFGHGEEGNHFHYAHVVAYHPEGEAEPVKLENGRTYYFRLRLEGKDGVAGEAVEVQAEARGNLFNQSKLNNFILGTLFSVIILVSIGLARRRTLYIRRIAGLEALDEALGRATEMGKAVLFIHGLNPMSHVSTIASVNILGRVARRTAEYGTQLQVANRDPVVMAVSQEVVKESYLEAGRPDAYNPDSVFMAATEQFSYAAALQGMMVREQPAAHIMMGYFYAESLLLAETGSATGAIQIAGTDSYTQLPFFVTTCDYTLMGEELYAASAYLAREPKLLGSLKGQDVGKAVLIFVLVVGTLLATLGVPYLTHAFTAY